MSGSILIKHGHMVTMEKDETIRDGSLLISDGIISAVGRTDELAGFSAEHVVDAKDKIVIPGFINGHEHTQDSFYASSGLDVTGYGSLLEYLKGFKWPVLLKMSEEDYHLSSLLGYLKNMRSGVTTIVDNYYGPRGVDTDGVAKAAVNSGLRSVLVKGYHDFPYIMPEEFFESTDELPGMYRDFHRRWQNKAEGRIRVAIGPVNLIYDSPESIRLLTPVAEELDMPIHTHVAESKRMVDIIKQRHGKGYVEVFGELGALSHRFQAAHCIWISEREIQLLKGAGSTVIHNPASNSIVTNGVAPVPALLREGVNVALGTDTFLDMLTSMRFAVCLHKVTTMNPNALDARTALKMATLNGAKGLGLQEEIGSLRVGKKADITIVNLKGANIIPVYDPLVSLVYFAQPADVDTVIVNGKILMEGGQVKTVREDEILVRAQKRVDELSSFAKAI